MEWVIIRWCLMVLDYNKVASHGVDHDKVASHGVGL